MSTADEPVVSRGTLASPEKALPARWRRGNPEMHRRNRRKIKRNSGHEYVNKRKKSVPARELGLP